LEILRTKVEISTIVTDAELAMVRAVRTHAVSIAGFEVVVTGFAGTHDAGSARRVHLVVPAITVLCGDDPGLKSLPNLLTLELALQFFDVQLMFLGLNIESSFVCAFVGFDR
jgi:hypothetical protein